MPRPSVHGERMSTAVRIPVDLHARLVVESEARDVAINHLIVKATRYYLDNVLVPVDPAAELTRLAQDQGLYDSARPGARANDCLDRGDDPSWSCIAGDGTGLWCDNCKARSGASEGGES